MSNLYRPALNMGQYHFQRYKNGIRVTGTWLFESNKHAPCLVLTPASALPIAGTVTPIVIPLREAWRYAVTKAHGGDTIGDPEHTGMAINEWLGSGILPGNPWNKRDHFAILDAINDNLRDLYDMPPHRPTERVIVGEFTTITANGRSQTMEIADNV
jgi:hypothetical protein